MFAVIFEARPRPGQWDAYLDNAARLRSDLEQVDGFIDNIRYRSLTRDGWILSLSDWRDGESLLRRRTHARPHEMEGRGRSANLAEYHLRGGVITHDTRNPTGPGPGGQRPCEAE